MEKICLVHISLKLGKVHYFPNGASYNSKAYSEKMWKSQCKYKINSVCRSHTEGAWWMEEKKWGGEKSRERRKKNTCVQRGSSCSGSIREKVAAFILYHVTASQRDDDVGVPEFERERDEYRGAGGGGRGSVKQETILVTSCPLLQGCWFALQSPGWIDRVNVISA